MLSKRLAETGRNSFLFRAPIVWNSLDSRSRFSEELDVFKAELKRNKKQLKKVSFSRGTITNSNKDLGKECSKPNLSGTKNNLKKFLSVGVL